MKSAFTAAYQRTMARITRVRALRHKNPSSRTTALVFLHLVVSFPHQSLVYYKRFCLVHCFILNFLSWTLNLAKHATPFAPSPLQKLQHYYEVVRHRHGHQYFLPCVSRLSAFSLSIPCLFLLFLQRAHVKFMPSLHRTPSRQ